MASCASRVALITLQEWVRLAYFYTRITESVVITKRWRVGDVSFCVRGHGSSPFTERCAGAICVEVVGFLCVNVGQACAADLPYESTVYGQATGSGPPVNM